MGEGRERRPPRGGDGDEAHRERMDQLFTKDMETRIKYFMVGDEQELEFEPMNSYKRRLIHQVAKPYNLKTDSRGEEPHRYVCLIKTKDSKAPSTSSMPRLLDFGNQTFPINPGADGVRLALKADGSIELCEDERQRDVLDVQMVTSREVRIRKGKIVQPGEPNW